MAGRACPPGTLCRLSSIVLARLFRRQYRHSEYGRFLIQTERTRDLVADRRQIAQILDDGADIGLRQRGICAPWHDGREDAAIRPNSRLNGGAIWSLVQLPRPVTLSGVRFGATNTPRPGTSKPTSEPPRNLDMSGFPKR